MDQLGRISNPTQGSANEWSEAATRERNEVSQAACRGHRR